MPDHGSQTIRRRRLAAELRRLREQAGLTGPDAADRLGWSASKLSRIETHRTGLKAADLERLLDLYQVESSHRAAVQALARESGRASLLDSVPAGVPPDFTTYLDAETDASSAWIWDPQIVPGIMQADSYARALLSSFQSMLRLPPGDAERRIEIRKARQKQLADRETSFMIWAIIDESVLYRRFGDSLAMREQMAKLSELSALPNVRLQVLPLPGEHPIGTGAFTYLQFPQRHDVSLGDLVYVEHLTGSYYLEDEQETFQYRVTFDALAALAAGEERSQELIHSAAASWAGGPAPRKQPGAARPAGSGDL